MEDPNGAAPPARAAPLAARCGSYIPADVFRERLLQLANEYELMQASFAGLCAEGGGVLQASFASVSESGGDVMPTWHEEADEATPEDRLPEPALPRPPELEASEGWRVDPSELPDESEQGIDASDVRDSPSSLASTSDRRLRRQGKKSVLRAERPEYDWRTRPFAWLAASPNFERFIAGIIVLNVAFLGVSTGTAMSDARGGDAGKTHVSFQAIEAGFLVIYTLEMVIRMVGSGSAYFTDENDRFWNFFDMALVFQSLVEVVGEALNMAGGAGNLTFLRGLRLLKTLKMLRVVRLMRSMRELRMILFAVLGSLKSMAWSMLLLVAVLYMFSLMVLQGMITYLEDAGGSVTDGVSRDIAEYWGDVHTGMLTLFMSSSGGIDWDNAFDALSHAGVLFQFLFLTYLTFFMFVIANAITSVFVEATFENATKDLFGRVQNNLVKKQEYVKNLHVLFEEMDEGKTGQLSLEDFARQVEDPKMLGFLSSMDLTIRDPSRFFSVLSDDGTKVVDVEQFVTSCNRLHGPAQAADVQEVLARQSTMHEMMCDLKRSLHAQSDATSHARCA